jgi:hypothetical protein
LVVGLGLEQLLYAGGGSASFAAGLAVITQKPILIRVGSGPLQGKAADATGYPLRTLMSCNRTPHLARPSILCRARRVPVPPGTHGEPRTLTVRISLTVHQRTSCSAAPLQGGTRNHLARCQRHRHSTKIRPSTGRQALDRREKS